MKISRLKWDQRQKCKKHTLDQETPVEMHNDSQNRNDLYDYLLIPTR